MIYYKIFAIFANKTNILEYGYIHKRGDKG